MFNKLLIEEYIKKISKEDIIKYGIKEGLIIDRRDVDTIYNYIKYDYKRIINNPLAILSEIKDKVSNQVYQKLLELYNKYSVFLDKLK